MRLIGLTGGVLTLPVVWAASPFRWWWGTLPGLRFRACTGLYLRRRVDWRLSYILLVGDVKRVG